MKKVTTMLGCLLALLMTAGPAVAQTVLTDVWKDKAHPGKAKKVAVFWIDQDRERRVVIEDEFLRQLKARGVDGLPVYIVIRPNKMVEKEVALNKIRTLGADAILTLRPIDKLTAQTQIPEPAKQGPADSSGWSGFYHYVYDPVTRDRNEPAYIETILFDSATEKRIWVARSVSKVEVANRDALTAIIKAMIDRLAADNMIK